MSQLGFSEKTKMEFEVFIKEGPGINTCGRERKKQEWVEKLSCGAGPTPWASGAHASLSGVLSRAEVARPLCSCFSKSGDAGRSITLVKHLLAAGAIPEELTEFPTAGGNESFRRKIWVLHCPVPHNLTHVSHLPHLLQAPSLQRRKPRD